MIAKRVAHRKDGKSSFTQLARYMADQKHDGEKVLAQTATNCQSEDLEWAVMEIEATQAKNTRATSDKTYHLVISFPPGEEPTKEQLKDIEGEVCRFVGLGDHQRVSAVHNDTDCLHIHVAINKIHPETLKMVEPYYDHYRLAEACQSLEIKHDLQRVNHATPGQTADSKALPLDEMRAGGQKPLADWLQERVSLEGVKDWQGFHKSLAEIGVTVKPKGAGFVFQDKVSGLTVKASAISRNLSGKKLIERLGAFEVPSQSTEAIKPQEVYVATPGIADGKAARAALWEKFSQERLERRDAKKEAMAGLRTREKADLAKVKAKYEKRRADLKAGKLVKMRRNKRGFYSLLKAERLQAVGAVKAVYQVEREAVAQEYRQPDWREWLQVRADQGSEDALEALRNAKGRPVKTENRVFGDREDHTLYQSYDYHVHRDGKVTYGFGKDGFTDTGKKLTLGKQPSEAAIEAALKMAVQKYGSELKIGGDAQFKARAEQIAKRLRIKIATPATTKETLSPVTQYVDERNSKRQDVYGILEHKEYKKIDSGQFEMAGLRNLGNVRAALLKRDDVIFVLELKESQYQKLKSVKRGDEIQIDKQSRIIKSSIKKGRTT